MQYCRSDKRDAPIASKRAVQRGIENGGAVLLTVSGNFRHVFAWERDIIGVSKKFRNGKLKGDSRDFYPDFFQRQA